MKSSVTVGGSRRSSAALQALTARSHVIFLGRASAGILAALQASGLRNRWVLMPANICYIAAWAVLRSGNRPFLVDVDPCTASITAETLNPIKLEHIGAVIACHMYGLGAPMREIEQWAHDRGALLIEDAALASGAQVDGRAAGSWGDVSVFSFGAGKIADIGIGGALLTDDRSLAHEISQALRSLPEWTPELDQLQDQWLDIYWALHQHEQANPRLCSLYPLLYETFSPITAYRLPDFPYRELEEALETLPSNLAHRTEIASIYTKRLMSLPAVRGLVEPPGSIYWRFPLLIDPAHRDGLLRALWSEGFHEVTRWYPSLRRMLSQLTPDPCYDETSCADDLGSRIVNLPVDSGVDADSAVRLATAICVYFAENSLI